MPQTVPRPSRTFSDPRLRDFNGAQHDGGNACRERGPSGDAERNGLHPARPPSRKALDEVHGAYWQLFLPPRPGAPSQESASKNSSEWSPRVRTSAFLGPGSPQRETATGLAGPRVGGNSAAFGRFR